MGGFGAGLYLFFQNLSQLQGRLAEASRLLDSLQVQQSNVEHAQIDLQTAEQALADCEGAGGGGGD